MPKDMVGSIKSRDSIFLVEDHWSTCNQTRISYIFPRSMLNIWLGLELSWRECILRLNCSSYRHCHWVQCTLLQRAKYSHTQQNLTFPTINKFMKGIFSFVYRVNLWCVTCDVWCDCVIFSACQWLICPPIAISWRYESQAGAVCGDISVLPGHIPKERN